MSETGLTLGRLVDPSTGKTTQTPLLLDADDLTTHGLIVGMTGSGKTALGIVLIEELLKKGIPVLAIDPKGDLGNLLLGFPNLSPDEFAPWVDSSTGATAESEAKRWTDGLAGWGLGAQDVSALVAARDAVIYTPGSTAGIPIDLLGSLTPPEGGMATEEGRDLVTSFVSALLGLVGIEADPVRSREHVLLSKCAEALFAKGKAATLEALVQTAAEPPFASVGALPLETFFPAKDRQGLVLALNNLLASPATAAFRAGAPLDVETLLGRRTKDGARARLSIFTISHLGDAERVFVVATLLSQIRSWLRRQPGSPSLKAVVYIDEIFGFFPPTAEPPTKRPLLALLKQARAFGTGIVLATQNPVDLDYKGLANCGAWWVGTLQTERDRARLTEGLASADGGGAALGLLDKTRKRVFLLHDVHRKGPVLVETRWAMSYLRGPMTKDEIGRLMGGTPAAQAAAKAAAVAAASGGATDATAPIVPKPWNVRWANRRGGEIGSAYLYIRYAVRYRGAKGSSDEVAGLRLYPLDVAAPGDVMEGEPVTGLELADSAPGTALRYASLPGWLGPATVRDVEKSVRERLPDKLGERLLLDPVTGKLSNPGENGEAFAARIATSGVDAPAALAEKLEKKRRELAAAEESEKGRSMETLATGLGAAVDLLGGLLGKRKTLRVGKVTSVLSKHRMESTAESKVAELRAEVEELEAKVGVPDPGRFQVVDVVPTKAQVDLLGIGVAWVR
jgi:Helicase HerA, central domain